MNLTWFLADLKSGVVQAELPLVTSGPIERTVSKAMSSQVDLQTKSPRCPANWFDLLGRKKSLLVPVLDGEPLHGFIPLRPTRGGPEVPISLMSAEHILSAAYCRDHYFDGSVDESRIIEALVSDVLVDRFGLELDVTDCGKTSVQEYDFTEDRRVDAAMADLSGKLGGPEWTVRVRWADEDRTRFAKVVEVGPQIGSRVESVVFDNRYLTGRQVEPDWTDLANAVQAVGEGSGADRPMSPILVDQGALDRGEPLWEERVSAPTLDDEAALTEYGEAALSSRSRGSLQWELSLDLTNPATPRPVRDFDAGDTVTMQLDATSNDDSSWHGLARLIGWRMSANANAVTEFSPVFWDPSELEVE